MKANKILLFLAMILSLSSCTANKKLAKKRNIDIVKRDTVIVKVAVPCPDAKFKIDTANEQGKMNVDLQDGNLQFSFNCDACANELDSVYHEYNLLNDLYNDELNKPVVYKIKNSFNETTKNSNNQTEVYKLKNSLLISNSKLDSVSFENTALHGKVKQLEKEITKNKNSNSGSGSNSAKSGNTSSKSPWYVWLIVFISGGIFFRAFPFIIKKAVPGLNIFSTAISAIKKVFV